MCHPSPGVAMPLWPRGLCIRALVFGRGRWRISLVPTTTSPLGERRARAANGLSLGRRADPSERPFAAETRRSAPRATFCDVTRRNGNVAQLARQRRLDSHDSSNSGDNVRLSILFITCAAAVHFGRSAPKDIAWRIEFAAADKERASVVVVVTSLSTAQQQQRMLQQ